MNSELKGTKPDKKKDQVVAQIFYNLTEILALYPQYSFVHHLATIIRKKDSKGKEFYHWTEEEFLKRIEKHRQELEGDELMNIDENEE